MHARIWRAIAGSSMAAMSRRVDPQRGQRSASTSKTRWRSAAQRRRRARVRAGGRRKIRRCQGLAGQSRATGPDAVRRGERPADARRLHLAGSGPLGWRQRWRRGGARPFLLRTCERSPRTQPRWRARPDRADWHTERGSRDTAPSRLGVTALDAKNYCIDMPKGTAMQLQERAYTSPIWYTP